MPLSCNYDAHAIPRYMQGFKCQVTGAIGNKKMAKARPPVWCADDNSTCLKGAKQMIVFQRKPNYSTR